MRLVVDLVRDSAMIEEALDARKVATIAVVAYKLLQLIVGRPSQNQRS